MRQSLLKNQRGISLSGFMSATVAVLFGALIVMRVIPAYIQYYKISTALERMASNAQDDKTMLRNPVEIRYAFQKQSEIDDIHSVTSQDLNIASAREGYDVGVDYEERIPMVANLSLVIHFDKSVRIERRE